MKTLIEKFAEMSAIATHEFVICAGNFKMESGQIALKIEAKKRHLQFLIDNGFKLDFKNKEKATNQNGNEFIINARAPIQNLLKIEKFNGKNGENTRLFSFMNDHSLLLNGFPYKRIALSEKGAMSRIIYPFSKAPEKSSLKKRLKMFKKGKYTKEKMSTTLYFA